MNFWQDMLEALKYLSTLIGENNLRTRRNLRSDIEKRSLAINEEFLSAFESVKEVSLLILVLDFCYIFNM